VSATLRFRVRGMTCAEEVGSLKRELGPLAGGEDKLSFDILNGTMSVAAALSPEAVVEAVGRTGMKAELWEGGDTPSPEDGPWLRSRQTALTITSGILTLAEFVWHAWAVGGVSLALGSEGMGVSHGVPGPARILYSLGILSGAWHILPKASLADRRLRPDMNLLMTIAVLGAVAIGEWFEAATVSFLFAVSLALESWSVGRARRAVAALMSLAPPTARRRQADGGEQGIPPSEVSVGDVFVVKPGERIPLDGRVVAGTSGVNQAPITGESLPVAKSTSDTVFAGSINGDGALDIECTKLAGDTTLAHIIRMVGEAQSKRAPSEQWVERFARVSTRRRSWPWRCSPSSLRRSFLEAPGATGCTARSFSS